jgi:hypothetical protein
MKIKLLFSCLLIAGTMGSVFAQDTPDPAMTAKIREEGMNHSQVMDIAFHLTDASGPRLAGSPAVGIPGFQFIQDPMDYGTRTHHSNQDTYDKLSEADLKQAATIVASFVYNASQREEVIPRKELPKPQTAGR